MVSTDLRRGSSRTGRGSGRQKFAHPKDRIKFFNIHPGDRVRLLVGKDANKYNDEDLKAKSGYKLYTVGNTDLKKSKVYLEGLTVSVKLQYLDCDVTHFDFGVAKEIYGYKRETGRL